MNFSRPGFVSLTAVTCFENGFERGHVGKVMKRQSFGLISLPSFLLHFPIMNVMGNGKEFKKHETALAKKDQTLFLCNVYVVI